MTQRACFDVVEKRKILAYAGNRTLIFWWCSLQGSHRTDCITPNPNQVGYGTTLGRFAVCIFLNTFIW
jgi:hypothetical protein